MTDVQFELGGVVRQLRFDAGALKLLRSLLKKDPLTDDEQDEDHAAKIAFAGILREHARRKVPCPITFQEVQEWFDEMSPKEHLPILTAFKVAMDIEPAEGASTSEPGADKKK
ncbi:hypothetical protein [Chitinophaga rhizosphaerae]|uniref:hypothetical protein n=1 Tax=Chitinophaga rhizosphaerae TaxID=1864947 RepID=UPI000F7FBC31|nr:hypothetical protein [Chitinophaga rhizosphaerae]